MGYYITDTASAVKKPRQKADPPSKKRVWKNFSTTRPRAGFFASQPVEPHWEKQPTPTTTASGVLYYGYRFYAPSMGRWLSRDPIGEEGGLHLFCFLGNQSVNQNDLLGLMSLSGKIGSIFFSRIITGGSINWVIRRGTYHLDDENDELLGGLGGTSIRDFYDKWVCDFRDAIGRQKATITLNRQNAVESGTCWTVNNFWLSASSRVEVDGTFEAWCEDGAYKYNTINMNWVWYDDIDANSLPGIAELKGEAKNVFQNDAPTEWALIEGLWDIIGDTYMDTDFDVEIGFHDTRDTTFTTICR